MTKIDTQQLQLNGVWPCVVTVESYYGSFAEDEIANLIRPVLEYGETVPEDKDEEDDCEGKPEDGRLSKAREMVDKIVSLCQKLGKKPSKAELEDFRSCIGGIIIDDYSAAFDGHWIQATKGN